MGIFSVPLILLHYFKKVNFLHNGAKPKGLWEYSLFWNNPVFMSEINL